MIGGGIAAVTGYVTLRLYVRLVTRVPSAPA